MSKRRRRGTRADLDAYLPPEPFWHFLLVSRALAGALALAIAVLWGWFAWGAARDDDRFEGQPLATGVLLGTERRTTGGKGASLVYATYRFETGDGRAVEGEDVVSAGDVDALVRTGRVTVQYLPGDARQNRLHFAYMTASTASRANRADAGIAIALLLLGTWLFVTGWRNAARQWEQAVTRNGDSPNETC